MLKWQGVPARRVYLAVVLMLCACVSFAQDTTGTSTVVSATDTTATVSPAMRGQTLITNLLAVAGWSIATHPTSATANGTVTRYFDGKEGGTSPIRIRFNGIDSYATETEFNGVVNTVVVRGGSGARWNGGVATSMSADSIKSWHFPFLLALLDLSAPRARVEYVATENVQAQAADRVHIWIDPDPKDRGHFMELKYGAHLTLWISQATGLPVQIEFLKQNFSRLSFNTRRRMLGDYRNVNGVMVPFHQEEWDGRDKIWEIQFDTVQWNVPLSATDFPLATGGQQ